MSSEAEARERILLSAERLFAAKGFAGTTVRDIAKAADLNLAMIHYYFGNKDGLYRAIFEQNVSAVQRMLSEAAGLTGSSRARLTRFVRAYTRFLCRHPHFARISQQEILNGGKIAREVFRPQVARNYAIFRALVDEGVRSGEFRSVDVDMTPISAIGMIVFFMIAQPVIRDFLPAGPDQPEFEARLADHTISILLNGMLATRERSQDASAEQPRAGARRRSSKPRSKTKPRSTSA